MLRRQRVQALVNATRVTGTTPAAKAPAAAKA